MAGLIHDQWSSCRALIRSLDGTSFEIAGEQGVKDSDLTAAVISKDIHQPAGGFSLTVQPSQKYLDEIEADDWIEIYLDNGDGKGERNVLFGLVDSVGLSANVDSRGAEKETIQITGRDWGKVLVNTQLIFDPSLPDQAAQAFGEYLTKWANSRTGVIVSPGKMIYFFLKSFLDGRQFMAPGGYSENPGQSLFNLLNVDHLEEGMGYVKFNEQLSLSGSLWQLLETYSVPILNELFTDWDFFKPTEGFNAPTLRFREYQFGPEEFAKLDSFQIPAEAVISKSVRKSDADVRNWFRLYVDWAGPPDGSFGLTNQRGYLNAASIKKHGVRRLETTTNGLWPKAANNLRQSDVNPSELLLSAMQKISMWHCQNERHLAGPITTKLLPDAHVGWRCDYDNDRTDDHLSFYCEGLTHNFAYGEREGSTTTVQLTRGTPRTKGGSALFPELLTFDQLLNEGTLLAISDFNQSELAATGAVIDAIERLTNGR